ncbi:MAG: 2-succinyl-5-enolpyruvyl-6-hydroxy-3-cyclohexene-1-carboxylic-acid synthase [Flavobacteriales bacterium]|nr:2-succinyl-5-enolpyruvyl-6-hydroxy-3-cyclohexene-1-carboxylic-acid synthase [Flavobacteriales bacterium]
MLSSGITHITHLVELCASHGIQHIILSPGSRNAPLVIAFDAHPEIKTYVIHDERSAAFFALGLAESLGQGVAICCTSGSAPLNYSPAIAEAYYRNVPLLILTADRPPELIDQGDGQTIRQKNVYQNFIKAQFELPCLGVGVNADSSDQMVMEALSELSGVCPGPVHLNIPLAEPLYELKEYQPEDLPTRQLSKSTTPKFLTVEEEQIIQKEWASAEKKLIIIGQQNGNYIPPEALNQIIQLPSVAVLVENTSNFYHFQKVCHCIDRTLATISPDEIEDFKPDLLISLGGAVISKRIKKFFRENKPKINWRVGEFNIEEDTYQSLTHSFKVSQKTFFDHLLTIEDQSLSNFGSKWKQRDFEAGENHEEYVAQSNFSDLKAFDSILQAIPESTNLQMGNSSTVRYCQLFDPIKSVHYYSNRGVSGIDGCSSTALGMANGNDQLTVLISGDTSFFYDTNAFWNNYLRENLRVIVMNNGGGGIFEFIDGPSKSGRLDYFYAPHKGKIKELCHLYGMDYLYASSFDELEAVWAEFYSKSATKTVKVLEVDTAQCENAAVLKDYFKVLKGK